MRRWILAMGFVVSMAAAGRAQQPVVVHAQLVTKAAEHGLAAELDAAKRGGGPVWVGWSIPVDERSSSDWGSDHPLLLEGSGERYDESSHKLRQTFDRSVILLRVANGQVEKLRVERPDRELDAGGLRFVWLDKVAPEDSARTLAALAKQGDKRLRDSAVFAVSIHQTPVATEALAGLAAAGNEPEVREKAAFWLANQRGSEGFKVIQRLAREDGDARFREKLTFDLTLVKEPGGLTELIRMAHEDASPQVRRQAQFWMATKGGTQVAGDLRRQAESDPEEQVRKSAVFALSRLPGPEAATQLIQVASTNKDAAVRKQAVFWLGQSSDPRALEYLTKLLQP